MDPDDLAAEAEWSDLHGLIALEWDYENKRSKNNLDHFMVIPLGAPEVAHLVDHRLEPQQLHHRGREQRCPKPAGAVKPLRHPISVAHPRSKGPDPRIPIRVGSLNRGP